MIKSSTCYFLLSVAFAFNIQGQKLEKIDSANFYFKNYQFDKVIRYFKKHQPKNAIEWQTLAKAHRSLGNTKEAKKSYHTALKLDSLNPVFKNELALLYIQEKNYLHALKLYNELKDQHPTNPFYWRKIASTLASINRPIEAIAAYQKAIQLNPVDQESSLKLASLFMDINEYSIADSILEELNKNLADNLNIIQLQMKSNYLQKGYEDVVVHAERLFELADSSLIVRKLAGIAYYRIKQPIKAVELLKTVVEHVDNTEIIHFYLGLSYKATEDHQLAKDHLEQAIEAGISENIATYYTQLGASLEELGDYKGSIDAYKIAYESSNEKILLYHLARNYDKYYKDKSIALKYYQKYLSFYDTINRQHYNYSKHRVSELKAAMHFNTDSL